MRGIRFVPDNSTINFMGLRTVAFIFSFALVFASFFIVAQKGLNLGIDFTGGTVMEIRTPVLPNLEALRSSLNDLNLGAISIQEFGDADDLLIRIPAQKEIENADEDQEDPNKVAISLVREALGEAFEGQVVDYRRIEFVGPQVGKELKLKGVYAIVFSLIGIMAYIWFRFEWQYGVAAISALIMHDVIATLGLFSWTQMEFSLSTVAAILLVAGYSINDTVVVFDRIRENLRKYKKMPLWDLFNLSLNQTLSRTLMTSGTTLLALIALYAFGGEVIRSFVSALIFGILIGTYSSIFVASPFLLFMNVRRGATVDDNSSNNSDDVEVLESV